MYTLMPMAAQPEKLAPITVSVAEVKLARTAGLSWAEISKRTGVKANTLAYALEHAEGETVTIYPRRRKPGDRRSDGEPKKDRAAYERDRRAQATAAKAAAKAAPPKNGTEQQALAVVNQALLAVAASERPGMAEARGLIEVMLKHDIRKIEIDLDHDRIKFVSAESWPLGLGGG